MTKNKTPPAIPPESPIDNSSKSEIAEPVILTPLGVGIKVDDVNKSLWQYVRKRKLWELILIVPLIVVWEVFVIFLFAKLIFSSQNAGTNNANSGRGFGYLIVLPFIVLYSWIYKIRKQFEDAFLEEFAHANEYNFELNGQVNETYGTVFRLVGIQTVSDVVSGKYHGHDMRLFLHDSRVGSGNNQSHIRNTVIEIDLEGNLPNIMVANKKSKFVGARLDSAFGIKNIIKLEGDFNEYFTLYTQEANSVEALQVFSPDTMALMEDQSKNYTVEFAANKIYIYATGFIGNIEQITHMFGLAKKLIDKIAPLALRLKNDSAIIPTPINLAANNTNKKKMLKHMIIFIAILITTIIITTVGVIIAYNDHLINNGTAPSKSSSSSDPPTINATPIVTPIPAPQPDSVTPEHAQTALAVSNSFLDNLRDGNNQAAYSKTTQNWQAKYTLSETVNFYTGYNIGNTPRTLINTGNGSTPGGHEYISFVYKYNFSDGPFYVKTWVAYENNNWGIDLLDGNSNEIQP